MLPHLTAQGIKQDQANFKEATLPATLQILER
jgi:hypothetical protein